MAASNVRQGPPSSASALGIPRPGDAEHAAREADVEAKQQRVAEFLEDEGYDAVLLNTQESFAWFSSGGDNSLGAPGAATASLFVTRDRRSVVVTNTDSARIFSEELGSLGFQLKEGRWDEPRDRLVRDLCQGRKVASDTGVCGTPNASARLARLRIVLTELERERYRALGRDVAHALQATCRAVKPGETELEVAGQLAHRLWKRGILPVELRVVGNDRAEPHRRAVAKGRPLRERCQLVAAGRRHGLCAAATRTVCFAEPGEEFRKQYQLAIMVGATYVFFSRPGETAAEVFQRGRRIYEKFGYPDEWTLADQGEVVGYSREELPLLPEGPFRLGAPMALSWHPSVGAARVQDTVVIDDQGFEPVTVADPWPLTVISVKGTNIEQPALLVRE